MFGVQAGGNLFGGGGTATTTSGLFGIQGAGANLFGGGGTATKAVPTGNSIFGGTAGQPVQQQQQLPITEKTKVSELPDSAKDILKNILQFKCITKGEGLKAGEIQDVEKIRDLAKTLNDVSRVQIEPVATILKQLELMTSVADKLQHGQIDKSFYE